MCCVLLTLLLCLSVCSESELQRQASELGVPVGVLCVNVVIDKLTGLNPRGSGQTAMISSSQRVCSPTCTQHGPHFSPLAPPNTGHLRLPRNPVYTACLSVGRVGWLSV